MKSFFYRIALVVAIAAMTSVFALANHKREQIIFTNDIHVNGTLVKKGTYEVAFNNETGEVSISRGNKIIAQAIGRLEQRDAKARRMEFLSAKTGDETRLVSFTFSGSDQNVVIESGS